MKRLPYAEDDLSFILQKTESYWRKFCNKTLFVTGGTGFFGTWLLMSFIYANRTLKLNAKIILLTRDKKRFLEKAPWVDDYLEISFCQGDIVDFEYIENKIDFIIHAATEASAKLNIEKPLKMFETVVEGTKWILEFARIKDVQSFLYISSGAVYGKQPSDIQNLPEEYIGAPETSDPASMYGEGKRMGEVLCSVYHEHFKLPVKIARCYAFVGPYLPLDSHFAAGNFIKNILNEEDILINGDGSPFRSYLYSADLMIWLWTILLEGENNRPYNVGSDKSISILELAQKIANIAQQNTQVIVKTSPSGNPAQRYVPNIDRAKNELGLDIYTDIETSIVKTIEFNKINIDDITGGRTWYL